MHLLTIVLFGLISFSTPAVAASHFASSAQSRGEIDELLRNKDAADALLELVSEQAQSLRDIDLNWPAAVPCEACGEALCSAHEALDDAALLKASSEWLTAGEQPRLELIEQLGKASAGHANRPNPAIQRFLIEAMGKDDSWRVRSGAAFAIGRQPEAHTSFDALKERLIARHEPASKARKKVDGSRWGIRRVSRLKEAANNEIARMQFKGANQVSRMKLTPELTELVRQESEWGAVVIAIGRCEKPKASKYLLELAQGYPESSLPACLHQALLETPTQARVQVFVDRFKTLEKEIKDISKEIKQVEKRKMPRPPKGYKGTPGIWAASNAQDKISDIGFLVDRQNQIGVQQESMHASLMDFVNEHAYKLPKLKKAKYHSCWKSFVSSNKRNWPRALGE